MSVAQLSITCNDNWFISDTEENSRAGIPFFMFFKFFKEQKLFFSPLKDGIYCQLFFKSHQTRLTNVQTDEERAKCTY